MRGQYGVYTKSLVRVAVQVSRILWVLMAQSG